MEKGNWGWVIMFLGDKEEVLQCQAPTVQIPKTSHTGEYDHMPHLPQFREKEETLH